MRVDLLYFLAKWSYRLLRPYMVELIGIRADLEQGESHQDAYGLILDMLDELFDYSCSPNEAE